MIVDRLTWHVVCLLALTIMQLGTAAGVSAQTNQTIELSDGLRANCLKILREGMRQEEEFWPSIHAAEGLTLAGQGEEVRASLEAKLQTEQDDQQRCGLARELVRAGDIPKVAIMLAILTGEDPHGHVHACESLYKVGEIDDGQAMRISFETTENVKQRLMAAAALGRCGNPAAMQFLRKQLAVTDAETSRTAAWILGRIGDKSDIPQLKKNVAAAADDLTRSYNEHALAALGDPEGLQALQQNLSHDDPAIRTYAATFAGDARAIACKDDLAKLLDDAHLDVRIRAAQSLLVLAQPAPPDPHEDISEIVYQATKQNPRYTEGSIVRLQNGSLLFAVTEFVGGGSDFAEAHLVARRSEDGGRTWAPSQVLQESTGKLNVMSVTLRRLKHPNEDTIALFYLQKNSFDDLRVYVRFSQDDARTFGEPVLVTTQPGYHVMNNDRVTQLSNGRLLVPVASTADVQKVNHFVSYCWLSDDRGQTWRKGQGQVDQPRRGAMEPEVVELEDGRVMMIARTQLGFIAVSYSADGGETWSDPEKLAELKAPEAPASLRRIPATGDLVLIWNNTFQAGSGHGGKRTPLTAAISADDGKTWKQIRDLESDSEKTYAYTSLVFTQGRAVMSYWESDEANQLSTRFRSLPVAWFYRAESPQE